MGNTLNKRKKKDEYENEDLFYIKGLIMAVKEIDSYKKKDSIKYIRPVSKICDKSTNPCIGHGNGIIILFEDNTFLGYECDSVITGMIMWYYERDQCEGCEHFTKYISNDMKTILREKVEKAIK